MEKRLAQNNYEKVIRTLEMHIILERDDTVIKKKVMYSTSSELFSKYSIYWIRK